MKVPFDIEVRPSRNLNLFLKGLDGKPTSVRVEIWAKRLDVTTWRYEQENITRHFDVKGGASSVFDVERSGDSFLVSPTSDDEAYGRKLEFTAKTGGPLKAPEGTPPVEIDVRVWEQMADWGFGQDTLWTVEDAFLAHASPLIYAKTASKKFANISDHGFVRLSIPSPSIAVVDSTLGRVRGVAAGMTILEGTAGGSKRTITVKVEDMLAPRLATSVDVRGDIASNYNLLFLSAGFRRDEEPRFNEIVDQLRDALTMPRNSPYHELRRRLNIWRRFEPTPVSGIPRTVSRAWTDDGASVVWRPPALFEAGERDDQNPEELMSLRHPCATQLRGPLGRYLRTLRPDHDPSQLLGESEWSYQASGPKAGMLGKSVGLVCLVLNSRRANGGTHTGTWLSLGTGASRKAKDVAVTAVEAAHGDIPLHFEPASHDWGEDDRNTRRDRSDTFIHELSHGFRLGDEYGSGTSNESYDIRMYFLRARESDNLGREAASGIPRSRVDLERDIPWSTLDRIRRADAVVSATGVGQTCTIQLKSGRARRWKVGTRVRIREGYVDPTLGTQTRRSKRDGSLWAEVAPAALAVTEATVTGVNLSTNTLTLALAPSTQPFPVERTALIYEGVTSATSSSGIPLDRDYFDNVVPAFGSTPPKGSILLQAGVTPSLVPGAVVLRRGGGGGASLPEMVSPSVQCKMNEHRNGATFCFVCKYLLVNRIDPSLLGEVNDCGCSSFMAYPGYLKK